MLASLRTLFSSIGGWCAPISRSVWLPINLCLAIVVPGVWGSANAGAKCEIRKLQRRNRWNQREPVPFLDLLTGFIDRWLPWIAICVLPPLCLLTFMANINPWVLFDPKSLTGWFMPDYPWLRACQATDPGQCLNGDNYHALLGTIQATVLGLLIPIAISAYELMMKERHLKDEMKDFVMKEARVDLIVRSSIGFLIWLGFIELLKVNLSGFRLTYISNTAEWIWGAANLMLTAYFMAKILGFLSQSNFNRTMRRFILHRAYERELRSKIAGLRYRNLTRYDRDPS